MTVAVGPIEMAACLSDGIGFRVEGASGCLLWEMATPTGYGPFLAAWEAVNGPIPDGLSPRHACRGGDKGCINPEHLALVPVGCESPPHASTVSLGRAERAAFARQIADERGARGDTRASFARALSVSASTVRAWELGARAPSADEAHRIAHALGWDGHQRKWVVVAAVERVVTATGAGAAARQVRDKLNVAGHADKVVVGHVRLVE